MFPAGGGRKHQKSRALIVNHHFKHASGRISSISDVLQIVVNYYKHDVQQNVAIEGLFMLSIPRSNFLVCYNFAYMSASSNHQQYYSKNS